MGREVGAGERRKIPDPTESPRVCGCGCVGMGLFG